MAGPAAVRGVLPLLTFAIVGCASSLPEIDNTRENPRLASAPNVVVVLLDDLEREAFAFMPRTQRRIADSGATFTESFVSSPLCCPSRMSLLRGQYAHNTGVVANGGQNGGFAAAFRLGTEKSTVATWLQGMGYRTALFGKYLNFYPLRGDSTYIPPGWTRWGVPVGGTPYAGFNYRLNLDGRIVALGDRKVDYATDVLAEHTERFVRESSEDNAPFFVVLSTFAPHAPSTPAPRHRALFSDASPPVTPASQETDLSDKPSFMRDLPPSMPTTLRERLAEGYRLRLRSLQAVDEAVERLVDLLARLGELERTLIIVTSDNGFHVAAHGLPSGKETPFEEDLRVPLVMRGLGITPGTRVDHPVINIDLAPTIVEVAGAEPDIDLDGRSLVALLRGGNETPWREGFLIARDLPDHLQRLGERLAQRPEGGVAPAADIDGTDDESTMVDAPQSAGSSAGDAPDRANSTSRNARLVIPPEARRAYNRIKTYPSFRGVRSADGWSFVRHGNGDVELYDLTRDPHQLVNLAAGKRSMEVDARLDRMSRWTDALTTCKGSGCQAAESPGTRAPRAR